MNTNQLKNIQASTFNFKKVLLTLLVTISGFLVYGAPVPINDEPCNAITLTVQSSCNYLTFSNSLATPSLGIASPSCSSNVQSDIWFQLTVPPSGPLQIQTQAGTLVDAAMAVYEGDCNQLTEIDCSDDANGTLMPYLSLNSLTSGNTLWIRVWGFEGATGSFGICVTVAPASQIPPPFVNVMDCNSAAPFCVPTPNLTNSTGVPSLGGGGIYGCLGSTPNPFFYFLQIQNPGTIVININQTNNSGTPIDVDYIVWGPFTSQAAGCAGISAGNIVSCSYSASASETATINNAQTGQFYIFLVTNFSGQAGTITFQQGIGNTGSTNCGIVSCSMTALTANPTICNPATNTYSVNGQITFAYPPASGTLTVSSSCGGSINIPGPWVSPLSYSLPGLNPTGGPCTITAVFSASVTCTLTRPYISPAPCTPCTVVASNTGPYCVGSPISLTSTTPTVAVTYSWAGPNGFTSNLQNPSLPAATTSMVGTYTLTATVISSGLTCTSTTNVVVTPMPVATFTYISPNLCSNSPAQFPIYSGGAIAGTFTAVPSGLNINAINGQITLSSSTPGTYTITNTVAAAGGCPSISASFVINITALPIATFDYPNSPYCQSSSNPLPNFLNGGIAGNFTATPAGISFVSNATGQINLSGSAPGTYTVTNLISSGNGCSAVIAKSTITIVAPGNATFNYPSTPYCQSATNPNPVFTGGGFAGVFSSSAGLSINSTTGMVDLAASTPGTYTVTNTIAATAGCPAALASSSITITPLPVTTFDYQGAPFCQSSANPLPTFIGLGLGGVFTASPGLSINSSTGELLLASSSAGSFTVTNTITAAGGCPQVVSSVTVAVTASPSATFSFVGNPYCQNAANPTPTINAGAIAGVFASTSGLVINAVSGLVDLANSTSGTYIVTNTIPSGSGCPAVVATNTITITPLPLATFDYTGSPFCQTAANPSPNFLNGGVAGIFSSTPGLSISSANGLINLAASQGGNYTVTNTIAAANGCPVVTATYSITITTLPITTFNYSSASYCTLGTNPSPIFSGGGVAGTFSSTSGIVLNAATGTITLATSNTGNYQVSNTIAANAGCPVVTTTVQVTIFANPVVTPTNNSPICAGTTLNLVGNNILNATYVWSGPMGYSSAVQSPTVSSAAQTNMAGTYTLTITENGCSSSATTVAFVNVLPTATISGGSIVCVGTPINPVSIALTGTAPWTIAYNDGAANSSIIANSSPQIINNPSDGTYTIVSISDANCSGTTSGSAIVKTNPIPVASATITNNQQCAPLCTTFNDLSTVQAPDIITGWAWSFGDGTTSNSQNPSHCFTAGNYAISFTVVTNSGCSKSIAYPNMVQSYQVPNAVFAAAPTTSILNPTVYFSNYSTGGDIWSWNFGDSLATATDNQSNLENPSHIYSAIAQYCVELIVSNVNNCYDTALSCIKIIPTFSFYIPNAFTPNSDDNNNEFFGLGANIKDFEMQIFDRWGNKVFSSNKYQDHWDGKMNGKNAQEDVYVYVIKIKDEQEQKHEYIGSVTLIR
jgi:gliding motility-associated-like protein